MSQAATKASLFLWTMWHQTTKTNAGQKKAHPERGWGYYDSVAMGGFDVY